MGKRLFHYIHSRSAYNSRGLCFEDLICSIFFIIYFICLFVFLRPNREIFTQMETHHNRRKASNFDQHVYSALKATEQEDKSHTYCDLEHPFMKERVSKLTYPTLRHCLRMLYTMNGNSKH